MIVPGLTAAVLQAAAGALAIYGAWRCIELQRLASDPRLKALAWFFGLFAASVLSHAAWELQIGAAMDELHRGGLNRTTGGNITFEPIPGRGSWFWRPAGAEGLTPLLVGHHLLMLASLAVGVVAFARRPVEPDESSHVWLPVLPAIGLVWVGQFIPLLLALQAALTLYLAVKALLNHMERKTPGALQVALGFGLFFLGHLMFFLAHRPGQGRHGIGDILSLVGILLLVQMLPRRA